MNLNKKAIKLVSGLLDFNFEIGIDQVEIEVDYKKDGLEICIQGNNKSISLQEVEKLKKALNTPKEAQVEEYYWQLVGDISNFKELALVGMIVDDAEVEYKNDNLKIKVYKQN
ncbi:hypothetical protein [Natroniella sp. ANB-PHB2]|uniref:hypothetical protein n=1 Tax=Natroniella sp. ANB-PHB2 TaxID=3384444 RepID=UPI0038D48B08